MTFKDVNIANRARAFQAREHCGHVWRLTWHPVASTWALWGVRRMKMLERQVGCENFVRSLGSGTKGAMKGSK